LLERFLTDDAGAAAIEYGLIAGGFSVAMIAVVSGPGSNLEAN
jgi:pilus assembly protein Flp/PilA